MVSNINNPGLRGPSYISTPTILSLNAQTLIRRTNIINGLVISLLITLSVLAIAIGVSFSLSTALIVPIGLALITSTALAALAVYVYNKTLAFSYKGCASTLFTYFRPLLTKETNDTFICKQGCDSEHWVITKNKQGSSSIYLAYDYSAPSETHPPIIHSLPLQFKEGSELGITSCGFVNMVNPKTKMIDVAPNKTSNAWSKSILTMITRSHEGKVDWYKSAGIDPTQPHAAYQFQPGEVRAVELQSYYTVMPDGQTTYPVGLIQVRPPLFSDFNGKKDRIQALNQYAQSMVDVYRLILQEADKLGLSSVVMPNFGAIYETGLNQQNIPALTLQQTCAEAFVHAVSQFAKTSTSSTHLLVIFQQNIK